jgi:hypothetical protein
MCPFAVFGLQPLEVPWKVGVRDSSPDRSPLSPSRLPVGFELRSGSSMPRARRIGPGAASSLKRRASRRSLAKPALFRRRVFWPPHQSKASFAGQVSPCTMREELSPGAKPPILGAARYPYSISIITSYFRGMTIIRTPDRTLALKCKQAHANGQEITIHYETPGGWNHETGIIQSVQRQRYRARPFSPFWEST